MEDPVFLSQTMLKKKNKFKLLSGYNDSEIYCVSKESCPFLYGEFPLKVDKTS